MSDDLSRHGGRCLCGAVPYVAIGEPLWVAHCHCESCRRATAAPLATYAGYRRDRFAYEAGTPARYQSSPGVTRSFCGRCFFGFRFFLWSRFGCSATGCHNQG